MTMKHSAYVLFTSVLFLSCSAPGPKEVTIELVEALSEGDCDQARELVVGDAFFIVQMIIDGGCVKDVMTLKFVSCTESENTANCGCIADRGGVEVMFNYRLLKENDGWKVSSWSLDF